MTTQPPEGPIQGELLPPRGVSPTNTLAVTSLILGILGVMVAGASVFLTFVCCGGFPFLAVAVVLGAAAAVCGHVALRQVREQNQRGREMAVAGLAAGYAAVGLSVVMLVLMILLAAGFFAAAAAGHVEVH
jgi:hypothetical protein